MVVLKLIVFFVVVMLISPYFLYAYSLYVVHKRKEKGVEAAQSLVCETQGASKGNYPARRQNAPQRTSGTNPGNSGGGNKDRVNNGSRSRPERPADDLARLEPESKLVLRPVVEAHAQHGDLHFTPDDDDIILDEEYLKHLEEQAAINAAFEEALDESLKGEAEEQKNS